MQNKQPSTQFFTDLEKLVRDFATIQGVDIAGVLKNDRLPGEPGHSVPASITFALKVADDGSHGVTDHDIRGVTDILTSTYGVAPEIIEKAMREKVLLIGRDTGFYLMAVKGLTEGPCPIAGTQLMVNGDSVSNVPTTTMPVLNHDHAWVPAKYAGQRPTIGDTVVCSWYGDMSYSWRTWDVAEVVADSEFVDSFMVVRKNLVKGGAVATPQRVDLDMMWTKVRTVFNLKVA